ncbi:unnamed protein product [Arctogadus glacialis]
MLRWTRFVEKPQIDLKVSCFHQNSIKKENIDWKRTAESFRTPGVPSPPPPPPLPWHRTYTPPGCVKVRLRLMLLGVSRPCGQAELTDTGGGTVHLASPE